MKEPQNVYTVPLPQPIPTNNEMHWHLITGGIAGGVSRTVTSPLERLKILRQCATKEYAGLNFWQAMRKFNQLEGIRGFFKGNGSNVIRIVPFSALEFYAFERAKSVFMPKDNPRHKFGLLMCGSISGIVASFFTYPLDLVRTILSIKTDNVSSGIIQESKNIIKTEGFLGLYRGLNMSLLGIAPFIGIKMSTFDILKANYLKEGGNKNSGAITLVLGGVAGAVATAITYPTDLLRRKMQLIVKFMQAFDKTKSVPYSTIVGCVKWVYATEGVAGFYKGLVPCFAKVIPAMAVAFAINEELKKMLKLKGS